MGAALPCPSGFGLAREIVTCITTLPCPSHRGVGGGEGTLPPARPPVCSPSSSARPPARRRRPCREGLFCAGWAGLGCYGLRCSRGLGYWGLTPLAV